MLLCFYKVTIIATQLIVATIRKTPGKRPCLCHGLEATQFARGVRTIYISNALILNTMTSQERKESHGTNRVSHLASRGGCRAAIKLKDVAASSLRIQSESHKNHSESQEDCSHSDKAHSQSHKAHSHARCSCPPAL